VPVAEQGVLLAVDVGSVRVGLAASDPHGRLAFPVATLAAGRGCAAAVAAVAAERDAVGVVVGLPVTLAGREGASAEMARRFATELAPLVAPCPVRLVDERLSTVQAGRGLAGAGVRGAKARAVIDQAAAVAVLQSVLDGRR
jgi:putative Holliday junction resolvase